MESGRTFPPQQLVLTSFSLHHIQKNQLIASDVAPRVGIEKKYTRIVEIV